MDIFIRFLKVHRGAVCGGGPEWAWPAVHKDRGPEKLVRPALAISCHTPASTV